MWTFGVAAADPGVLAGFCSTPETRVYCACGMIDDSVPWKELLFRKAAGLRKRRKQKRWTRASFASVEQDVFLSAYAIRKLLEAHKISDELRSTPVKCTSFPFKGSRKHFVSTGDLPDFYNWHRLEEFYDLESPQNVSVDLREFCNQIIHSWIFTLSRAEDGGLDGYFFSSDRERRRRLLYSEISETAATIGAVATDDIVHSEAKRNPATGQWRFTVRSRSPKSKPED